MDIKQILRAVKEDRIHGSSWIISRTLELLEKAHPSDRLSIAKEISSAHPEMSGLKKIVEYLIDGADIHDLIDKFRSANRRTSSQLLEISKNKIVLTISRSHILEKGLLKAKKVYVLESLPGGEGKALAKSLQQKGVDSRAVYDLFVSKLIDDCDFVISGADSFSEKGFVNKTGTMTLAIVSSYFNKPFYVVTPLYKHSEEISILRDIFEFVPFSLVSKVVFEDGMAEPEAIRNYI